MPEATTSSDSPLQPAAERVRSSAKWLVGAFGAIGAALAVGAQFSDIGKLEGSARDWAILGVALVFAGLGIALVGTSFLLVPKSRTLKELGEDAERYEEGYRLFKPASVKLFETAPELLWPFLGVRALADERDKYGLIYRNAYLVWSNARTAAHAKALTAAGAVAAPVEAVATRVLNWANYATLRSAYTKTLVFAVLPGVALTAAGIMLFALNVSDVPPSPTPAAVILKDKSLTGVNLSKAVLSGADLTGTDFSGSDLTSADLSGATLAKTALSGANLTGANLNGAKGAQSAAVDGAIWSRTTCPDGRLSNSVGGTCLGHLGAEESSD